MTAPAPQIVTGDLAARTRALLQRYADFVPEPNDPSDALVEAFAQLARIVADRINRAPDKNLLAFLELVGVRPLPPQPARVPLTFHLAAGATGAVVPARTTVAAAPLEGETQPVLYETEQELTATGAALVSLLSHEPVRDRYSEHVPGGGSLAAFSGDVLVARRIYVGFDDLARPAEGKKLLLQFSASGSLLWLALLAWERSDGQGGWLPAVAAVDQDAGTVTLTQLPVISPTTVAGVASSYVRARLLAPVPAGTIESGAVAVEELPPDAAVVAYADGSSLLGPDELSQPVEPFVATDSGSFTLACDDAFGKPGASVAIAVELDPSRPVLASDDLRVSWSYSTANGWQALDRSGPHIASESDPARVEDGSEAFTRSGTVSFAAPADWAATSLDGLSQRWLRAEIVGGAYDEAGRPLVARISVGYAWTLPSLTSLRAAVQIARTAPQLELAFANQQPIDLGKDFFPFGPKPVLNDAFYFADDDAFVPGATVALGVELTTPSGDGPPRAAKSDSVRLRWEYWNGSIWVSLGDSGPGAGPAAGSAVGDGTNAFQVDGRTVAILLPGDVATVEVNGRRRRWLRARIAGGDYGRDYHYVASSDGPGGFKVADATLAPPSIASLTVQSTFAPPLRPVDAVLTETESAVSVQMVKPPAAVAVSTPIVRPVPTVQASAHVPAAALFLQQAAAISLTPFAPGTDARPALYLGFDRPFGNVVTRLFVSPVPATRVLGAALDGSPAAVVWEWWDAEGQAWSRLEAEDETRSFTRTGLVTFVAPAGLAPSTVLGRTAVWLRARWARGVYPAPPQLERVLTNTMWAEQTTTVDDELLGSSTGQPGQRLRFARPPVLPGELVEVREPGPAGEPGPWTAWTEVVDFYGSGPFDRHYVLDRATGDLAFGDGRAGAIPAQGSANVRATLYRTGGGERGNRPAGAVSQLKTTVPYVDAVVNHEPATGGTDLETPDAVKERGPRTLRHGGRAVALEDFEDLAVQASPDLARVRGIPAPAAGGLGRVALIVVPRSGERRPAPTLELLAHVQDYLAARVTPTFDLLVVGPGWLKVTVEAEIAVVSLEAATDVESAVLAGLTRFLDPLQGGFDSAGWPFGRRPHRSDVEALIEAVPGVDYVRSLTLREEQAPDERPPVPDAFLVYSGDHAVTVVGAE